eukprot:COSAG05_NODE_1110_length_5859_cov_26.008507_2_plen_100_part_00
MTEAGPLGHRRVPPEGQTSLQASLRYTVHERRRHPGEAGQAGRNIDTIKLDNTIKRPILASHTYIMSGDNKVSIYVSLLNPSTRPQKASAVPQGISDLV